MYDIARLNIYVQGCAELGSAIFSHKTQKFGLRIYEADAMSISCSLYEYSSFLSFIGKAN